MAGCHFNSAISRLSFVYHRSLKIIVGQLTSRAGVGDEKDENSLIFLAKKIYTTWTNDTWNNKNIAKIHQQVNGIKHETKGIFWGRDANTNQAINATNELLTLLEAWTLYA